MAPRVGLDGNELEAAAGEDVAVDGVVQIEALVQAGLIDVEASSCPSW